MKHYTTVVVSNRLPVSVEKVDGELRFNASSGGLATAMASIESSEKIWVGWPGIASDELTDDDKRVITSELSARGCVPVFLTTEQIKLFYEGYANDTLWPLFHYFQSVAVYKDEYWEAYQIVNQAFSEAVQSIATPEATIWIQDYQLMLLPKLLRADLPESSIGFFLHIPFPSYEIFRMLPERREILEGLLGADLLGFHIYDYARHFLSSCLRLFGIKNDHGLMHYEGRLIQADAFPIGIDYDKFEAMRTDEEVLAARESLQESSDAEFTILSVDRLDYSKGIPQRLDAYKLFLDSHPEYLGRVKLVMVAVPSRTEVDAYKTLRDQIEVTVSRINGEYGTSEWAPISYQFQNLPFHEICALYAQADVMLVTPTRDGMNLVAKEYVASKQTAPGVLILSEMAGAVDELPESLSVNPNDTKSIEHAIEQALTMPLDEQQERIEAMQARIEAYPVKKWADDFFANLANIKKQQLTEGRINLSKREKQALIDDYTSASSHLLVLDYDGTLQTFKSSPLPSAAKPSQELHDLIEQLASQPNTTLAIVSGRKKTALEAWFGDTSARLVAEHGAWVKMNGTWQQRDIDFEPARTVIEPILRDYLSRTPGSRIEHKDFASVWHYRNVSVELAYVRASNLAHELEAALHDFDVSVYRGHKIIEVKPAGINKGAIVEQLMAELTPEFVFVAGDDYTDEDMFAAAPKSAHTIKVGPGETAAKHRLPSVGTVIDVLRQLAELNTSK